MGSMGIGMGRSTPRGAVDEDGRFDDAPAEKQEKDGLGNILGRVAGRECQAVSESGWSRIT
jgi:hypothetical protein